MGTRPKNAEKTEFHGTFAGDLKAFELIRDTVGEKPVERMEVSTITQETRDEVERLVSESLAETIPE